jgi:hypothetical protein
MLNVGIVMLFTGMLKSGLFLLTIILHRTLRDPLCGISPFSDIICKNIQQYNAFTSVGVKAMKKSPNELDGSETEMYGMADGQLYFGGFILSSM